MVRGRGTDGKIVGGNSRGRGSPTQAELDFPRTRATSSVDPSAASDTQTGGGTQATNSSAGLPPATPSQMPGYRLPLSPAHVEPPAEGEDEEMEDAGNNEVPENTGTAAAPKAKKGRGPNRTKVGTTDEANRVELALSPKLEFIVVNPTKKIQNHSSIVNVIADSVRKRNKGKWLDYGSQCQTEAHGGEGDVCWEFFKRKFRWNAAIEAMIEKLFRQIASRRLTDSFSYAKRTQKKPDWIDEKIWPDLLKYWEDDAGFKKRSEAGKQNRAKGPYLSHGHGSQSAQTFEDKFREDFVKEHGHEPDAVTVLAAAKSRKGQLIEGWQDPVRQLEQNHRTGLGDDRRQWPPVPTPDYWLQPRKGRVTGQGGAPPQLFGFRAPRRASTGIHIHVNAEPSPEERRERAKRDKRMDLMFERMAANDPELRRQARTEDERIDAEWQSMGVGSSTANPDAGDSGRTIDGLFEAVDRVMDEDEDADLANPENYLNDDGGDDTPDFGGNF